MSKNEYIEIPPKFAILRFYDWEKPSLYDNKPLFKEFHEMMPEEIGVLVFKRTDEIVKRHGEYAMVYKYPT